jgi:GMP synthase-like glutamine amidotransferase
MKPLVVLKHVAHEGLGTLADVLQESDVPFRHVDLFHEVPEDLDPHDLGGLIVMGGPMNVDQTDRYPFLAREVPWIARAIEAQLPVLGICLGSQLVAKALGSKVFPNPKKEIGWYEVQLTESATADPLLGSLQRRETVFQWHGDTFELPTGAVQLATSELCSQQAFRFGQSTWAFQFHMEVTAEMIDQWLREPGGRAEVAALDYIHPGDIRREIPRFLPPMERKAREVFGRFAEHCRQRHGREQGV